MVEREPRDHDVSAGLEARRVDATVDVGAHLPVLEDDAFRVRRRATRELQHRDRVGIVVGTHVVGRTPSGRRRSELAERDEPGIAGARVDELGEQGIDDHQRDVGRRDARSGLLDEELERAEAKGQRQHHQAPTGQPHGFDGRDQRAGGRPEDRDMVAGCHPGRLQSRCHDARVGVDLGPVGRVMVVTVDEHDGAGSCGRLLDAGDERQHR